MRLFSDFNPHSLRQFLSNTGWLVADKVLRLGLALMISVAIARALGPSEFGTLQYALSFVGMFGIMTSLGLDPIIVREFVRRPDDAGILLGTTLIMRLIAACSCVIIVLAFSCLLDHDSITTLMIFIAGSALLLQPVQVIESYFQAHTAAVRSSLVFMLGGLAGAAWVAYGLYSGAPVVYFSIQLLVEWAVIAAGLIFALGRYTNSCFTIHFNQEVLKTFVSECWPLALALLMVGVYTNIDKIMLRALLGDEAIGIYVAAAKLSDAWYFVPMVIVNSLLPAIVRARESSSEHYIRRLQDLYDLMVVIGIIIALPVSLAADWIIIFLYGEPYRQAGAVLSVYVWAGIFVFLGVASGRWFILEGYAKAYLCRTLTGVVGSIAFNLLLIPNFGVLGAAWAALLAQLLVVLVFDFAWGPARETFRMKCRALLIPYRLILRFRHKHGHLPLL